MTNQQPLTAEDVVLARWREKYLAAAAARFAQGFTWTDSLGRQAAADRAWSDYRQAFDRWLREPPKT